MKLKTFIDRPVLSVVISVVVVLLGVLALRSLPVEQYPDIAPPTINVYVVYPGANAETVQKSVIVPLEEAINGVENMTYMVSTASNSGDASIDVFFKQGTDADMAAVNVQNRVAAALGFLPAEVTQTGVTAMKQQNGELKTIALYCPDDRYESAFIDNYAKLNIEPRLKRIGGIGNVSNFCSEYSLRIWLDPAKMAQYRLVPSDIETVLANQNLEAATGEFGENHDGQFQYTMKYRGRKVLPEEFGSLVVKALRNGDVLRLNDVARIELGSEFYNFANKVNGHVASIITCYQTAGSNASATIGEIDEVIEEIRPTLPEGLEIVTLSDTNRFLKASIREVVLTLLIAVLLVVMVVYVFLQDLRSTLIPTVSIFVSIIGTFAAMSLMGFSINLLTLFALVLAIGTVVDDAIVVVEAVQARFDAGYRSAYLATHDALGGIAAAILVSTLIFMSVFVPVSMMGGTSGMFYRQFGLTMAVAVGISALNAFTLSPALCSLILKPYIDENGQAAGGFAARFRKAFAAVFDAMSAKYLRGVMFFIRRRWAAAGTVALGVVLLFAMVKMTKTGLVPQEDTGTVELSVSTQPGTSLRRTSETVDSLCKRIAEMPEVEYAGGITGFSFSGSGSSQGFAFIVLKDWDDRKGREHGAEAVLERIDALAPEFSDANFFASMPDMIPGFGMGGGLELYLQDRKGGSMEEFKALADQFVERLVEREEIGEVYSAFETDYPQYWVDIDAQKCEQAGIPPSEILNTLSMYFGGAYVSNFNRFSKLYRVVLQAEPGSRTGPESLENFYVRVPSDAVGGNEEMATLASFVTLTKTYGPSNLSRFNLCSSIPVTVSAGRGHSTGEAIRAVQEVAAETLPVGYGYEYGGMTREEAATTGNVTLIFLLCIALTYLILCALYESVFLPFAIILTVPCGLAGSFLLTWALGLENNIYLQTGVVMLIGLLAKTAILLTDCAQQNRRRGMGLVRAACAAASVRLRPILMTALTMVFGLLPMLFATGVGANGSRSLATGAVGGMILGTLVLLFIVPSLFIVFQWVHEKANFLVPRKPAAAVVALAVVLLLPGCRIYKPYKAQSFDNEENLYREKPEDTGSIAMIPWQEFFADTLLQGLIQEGIANNRDLGGARLKAEEAAAALKSARLGYLPSLSLSEEGGIGKWGRAPAELSYNVGAMASWELDAFGRATNGKRMAKETHEAAEAYVQAVQSQLVATIAQGYYSLLELDAGLSLYNETLLSYRETVRVLELLKEAGRTDEAAVLQARASVHGIEQLVSQAEQGIALAENALSVLLGRVPGRVGRGSLEAQTLAGTRLQTGLPIAMLRRRPDVRAAEHRLATAFYATNLAYAQFYPSLTLSGTLGFTNSGGGVVLNPGQWLLNAAAGLLQPLFNQGRNTANLRIARAQQEEARLEWEQTVLEAAREVNDALSACQHAAQNRASAAAQVALLEDAVAKTNLLMQHGSATYLEVLTAQQSLLDARSALLQHTASQLESITALYHALGGGIE